MEPEAMNPETPAQAPTSTEPKHLPCGCATRSRAYQAALRGADFRVEFLDYEWSLNGS
jgi:hypothetical protein